MTVTKTPPQRRELHTLGDMFISECYLLLENPNRINISPNKIEFPELDTSVGSHRLKKHVPVHSRSSRLTNYPAKCLNISKKSTPSSICFISIYFAAEVLCTLSAYGVMDTLYARTHTHTHIYKHYVF